MAPIDVVSSHEKLNHHEEDLHVPTDVAIPMPLDATIATIPPDATASTFSEHDPKVGPLQVDALKIEKLEQEPNSNFVQATFNCTSLLLGLGVLSSPYAVAETGWSGVGIAIVVAAVYAYAAILMARCQSRTGARTYQELAALALGRRSRRLVEFLFYVELAGSLMGYCISIGDNLHRVFPSTPSILPGISPHNFLILMASLCVLPMVWLRDLSALSFASLWSLLNSVLLFAAVLASATADAHIGFRHRIQIARFGGFPLATGIYAFAFGGTTVYPSVYSSMKDPSSFTLILFISFAIALFMVCGLGVAGAAMFGHATASQVTLNMPPHHVTTQIALWMTVLTPMLLFALVMSPISSALDSRVASISIFRRRGRSPWAAATAARSAVLALIVVSAMALPYFNYVIALIGSSITIAICIMFPCIFYVVICRDRLTRASIAAIALVSVLSLVAAVCGTIVSFRGLVHSSTQHHHAAAAATPN